MKRYIVFAYDKDGILGGHLDIYGVADNVEEIAELIASAQNIAVFNPNVIEVYDLEHEKLIKLYAINPEGVWIEHELKN